MHLTLKEDIKLISDLEKTLQLSETDMTIFYRDLSNVKKDASAGCAFSTISNAFYNTSEVNIKFAKEWEGSGYALKRDPAMWVELLLAAYSMWGTYLALRMSPALAPWLAVYSFAFAIIVLWGIHDRVALRRAQVSATS